MVVGCPMSCSGGGGSLLLLLVLVIGVVVPIPLVPPAISFPCLQCCIGVGGVSSCGQGSSWWWSSFHPQSTPRAVAREARGGWCVVRHHCGASKLVVLVTCQHLRSSSHVACTPIAPPAPPHEQWLVAVVGCAVIVGAISAVIHPTSSRS